MSSPRRFVVALAVGASLITGCGGGGTPEVPAGADPVLVEGRDVFVASCRSCHGDAGGGGRGPDITGGPMVDEYPEVTDQVAVVRDGRDGMPSFGDTLTDAEIEAVVRYTREVL